MCQIPSFPAQWGTQKFGKFLGSVFVQSLQTRSLLTSFITEV